MKIYTLKHWITVFLWLLCCVASAQTERTTGSNPFLPDSIAVPPDSVGNITTIRGSTPSLPVDQNLPVYWNTPEAAALAKMVNYPVNHNTGIPDISVPFHEVKIGELSLPIVLNYHAGGFKINERATRTGLGWSLSCDLQITRTINGLDDLGPGGYISNGKITQNSYPFYTNVSDPNEGHKNAYSMAILQEHDGMPDKFYYKLLNKSGAFYFLKDGGSWSIEPVPFDNVKIEYNTTGQFFTITDTDGTIYQFGNSNPPDFYNPQNKGVEFSGTIQATSKITTWKCVKITAPNRVDQIDFTYNNVGGKNFTIYRDRIEYWNMYDDNLVSPIVYADQYPYDLLYNYEDVLNLSPFHRLSSPRYMTYHGGNYQNFHLPYVDANGNVCDTKRYLVTQPADGNGYIYTSELHLKKISFRGVSVDFENDNHLNLKKINISEDSITKTINFYQSIVNGTNYLDSIDIGIDRYSFLYNGKYAFGGFLKGQDIWGFHNETTQEMISSYPPLLMPRILRHIKSRFLNPYYQNIIKFPLFFGGTNPMAEEPSEQHMQRGVLRRIIYPTGGFVNFDYEANRYIDDKLYYNMGGYYNFYNQRMSGGLRIKSITYYEGDSNTIGKQLYYVYGDWEEGTGNVVNPPELQNLGTFIDYKPYAYTQLHYYVCSDRDHVCTNGLILAKDSMTTFLPASSLDNAYPNGAPVYYTKVTEYQMEKGLKTGKTVYKYYPENTYMPNDDLLNGISFIPWNYYSMVPETNISYLKTDWYLGALESVSEYRYKSGKFHLTHRKRYEYQVYKRPQHPLAAYAFPSVIYKTVEVSPNGGYEGHASNYFEFKKGWYSIPMGKLLMTLEEEKWYENNVETTQTRQYIYGNTPWMQPTSIVTNDGFDSYTQQMKYTYDYPPTDNTFKSMKDMNIISPVIEERLTKGGYELSYIKNNYSASNNSYVKSSVERSLNGSPLENEWLFSYDKYGNIQNALGRDQQVRSYLWGYNSKYPVAEIIGNEVLAVYNNLSTFIANNPDNEQTLKTVFSQLHDMTGVMVNTYLWEPLAGIKEHTNPQKLVTKYSYDAYGRLITVRDHDEKVVQSLNYHYRKPSSFSKTLFNVEYFPRMETYSQQTSSGIGLFQAFWFGGDQHFEAPSPNYAAYIDTVGVFPAQALAKIVLPTNGGITLHFIQEGSIVATHTCTSSKNELYLLPGTYTMAFTKPPVPYNKLDFFIMRFGLYPLPSVNAPIVKTGDNIYMQAGQTYQFGHF